MNNIIIKSFISRLGFVSERTKYPNAKILDIKILNQENLPNENILNGLIIIKNEINEIETITFKMNLNQSEDILTIITNYESNKPRTTDKNEEIDIFTIIIPKIKAYSGPKIKYLIHLVDDQIKQAYIVNKKYKFENGINENYTKINMDKKDILNNINSIYSSNKSKR